MPASTITAASAAALRPHVVARIPPGTVHLRLGLKVKVATVKGMRIGEVARQAGIACSAIRFYEGLGLLPEPRRTASGYREYDQSAVGRLAFIRAGQSVGLSLDQLREVFEL